MISFITGAVIVSELFMKNKVILVTGAAGFIGSSFIAICRQKFPGLKIVGIDDFSNPASSKRVKQVLESRGVIFLRGSITQKRFVDRVFRKYRPDTVFHFAALPRVSFSVEWPADTTFVNCYGTALLLEKARDYRTRRFIFSSSSSVYGDVRRLPLKEDKSCPDPRSPYALQKYFGEKLCRLFSILYDLDTVCLRYFNVYGPGQDGLSPYATVIAAWLDYFFSKKKQNLAFLEGDGKQSRDFCYVTDVVTANLAAFVCRRKFNGEVINISGGKRISLRRVRNLLEKFLGQPIFLEQRPPRLGDVKHTKADLKKARLLLHWRPRVDFVSGLTKTIAWFNKNKGSATELLLNSYEDKSKQKKNLS
jgi:nucleoside-diphosphate-sugar epimerase